MLSKVPPPVAVSAAGASVSSGTVVFSNSNNVSFGQAGSTLTATASFPAATNFSAGVSNLGNTLGNTGIAGTRLVFAGTPNITLSQGTDANGATITISGGAGAAGNTGFVSAGGATASLGTVVFSNSNNVSFGVNGQTVTASITSQTNQTVGIYGSSQTTGSASSGTHDARSLSIIGAGIVSVGNHSTSAGGTTTGIIISATQSGQAFSASGGSSAFQTLSFNNANGFTFSNVGGAIQGSYTVPTVTNSSWTVSDSATSATVGRLAFTASNGLTLTLSTSNNGNHTVIGSYTVPTLTNSSLTMQAGASTLSSVSRIAFVDSNGVSFGASTSNNGSITITATVKTDYLTTADLSQNSSKYVQNWKLTGNTAGTTSSAQGTDLWISGGNSITVSGSSNTIVLSVGAYITTADLSQNSSNYFRNWKLTGNTAGTTSSQQGTDFWLSGGNNITLSGNSNTIVISAPNLGAGAFSGGASNLGNTAGATGVSGTRGVFVGTHMLTLSQTTDANGFTLSFDATQTNQSAIKGLGVSNTGNTLGNTGLSTGIDWVIAATSGGAITASQSTAGGGPNTIWLSVPQTSSLSATGWAQISTNGSTISIGATTTANLYGVGNTFGTSSGTADIRTISVSAGSGLQVAASNSGWVLGPVQISQYGPFDWGGLVPVTNSTLGQNSLYFQPFDVYWPISASRLNLYVSVATGMSAANSTGRAGYTISAALYSRQTGASTDRIASFWSMTAGMSVTQNSSTQLVATNLAGVSNSTQVSTVGTSLSTSNASTYMANSMGGYRVIPLPLSTNLTPGRYWLAVANSTTSSNAGVMTLNCSVMQVTNSLTLAFRPFGTSSAASNASFNMVPDGMGTYSATSGAFPSSVGLTTDAIRAGVTQFCPYFNVSGYGTATNAL